MKRVRICDFADVITGGTPSTSNPEYWVNGDIPWLQSGACQNCNITKCDTFITQKGLNNSAAKMMKPNSVLIALTGATTGKVGFLTFEACANQSVTGIQPNERFVPKYLYYYLKGIRQKILDDSYGGAQKHISQGYVKDLEVPLGTISEQTEIADIFERIDRIILTRQQQLQELNTLIKARFVEMFGNDDTYLKHAQHIVADVCESRVGIVIQPTQYYTEDKDRGIRAFRSMNVKPFTVYDQEWVYFSKEDNDRLARTQIHANDVAVVRSGANLGDSCVISEEFEGCNAIDILLLTCSKQVLPVYLCAFINYPVGKSQILNVQRGGAIKHLNLRQLEQSAIYIPPLEEQYKFADFVSQVDKSKVAVQAALEKAQLLFDSLMQQYFG